jgi:hypothetical protein
MFESSGAMVEDRAVQERAVQERAVHDRVVQEDTAGEATIEEGAGWSTGAEVAPGEIAAAWCRRITAVSELEWSQLDAPTTLDLLGELQRASHVVRGALAAGLAAVDGSRIIEQASGLSAGGWWANTMRGCGGEGTWLVRAGRLMGRFPELGDAVRSGDVSLEHLRALDGLTDPEITAALTVMDAELCRRARRLGLADWRRSLRRTVAEVRAQLEEQRRRVDDPYPGDHPGDHPDEAAGDGTAPDDGRSPEDPPSSGPGAGAPDTGGGPSGDSSSPLDHLGDGPEASASPEHLPFDGPEPDGSEPDTDPLGWLTCRTTSEGSLLLRGELVGHAAEVFRQALAAETSRRRRAAWREHDAAGTPMPRAGELRAEALLELIRRGVATDPTAVPSARTEAVVVIQADDAAADRIRSLDGEPLDAEVAALLSCDAHLQALVVDRGGQPLWLGRAARLASPAQRRALTVRDGGCVFPGCEMPANWCDVHHEPAWEKGGASDPDTMALLCRRHHGLAHTERWVLRRNDPPDGRPPDRHGATASLPGQRFEWHDRRSGRILPATQRGLR